MRGHGEHALLYQQPRVHEVGPGLEDEDHVGQVRHGPGAHDVESLDAVQGLLHRHGDQLLDVRRGHAEAEHLDLHPRRRELGVDVDRRAAELRHAEHDQQRRPENHEVAQLQARLDDPTHHGRSSLRSG